MATATATLKHYRQSPQKVRLVADLVRGKAADDAIATLQFTTKRAAKPLRKLIESAKANADQKGMGEDLVVKTISVNEGVTLKRGMPRAMGSMDMIRKRTSHVFVELAERGEESASSAQQSKKEKANA